MRKVVLMKKSIAWISLIIVFISAFASIPPTTGWVNRTELYTSDTTSLSWSGATTSNIGAEGYLFPGGPWSNAVETWEHPNWWDYIEPNDFVENGADWIWTTYRLSKDDKANGEIAFFQKTFLLPEGVKILDAKLTITTDNAYYFYVNDDWNGDPVGSDGFAAGYSPQNFYYADEYGNLYPREDSVPPDMTTWSTIEEWDLTGLLEGGLNELQIVAINHNPPPKSHHTSGNRAGLIYKLEVTYDVPLSVPAGFMIPLELPPPEGLSSIPTFQIMPVQAAWSPDINEDGRIDLVLGKPMALVLNVSGAASPVTMFNANFAGNAYSTADTTDDVFTIYPIVPQSTGSYTITGTYSDGSGDHALTPVDVTVKETVDLNIAYSYLYSATVRKGKIVGYTNYGLVDQADYENMVGNTTEFISSTYPVSNVVTDEALNGLIGASASKRDPFGALLNDALASAQDAQWRLGGSAFGIAIGPNNTGFDKDYFAYHGFPGAAGISFGPSVRGVVVMDGYYTGGAHEIAHNFGVYWGEPEQYQTDPPIGRSANGVDTGKGRWRSGICFMGAGPYRSLKDSWVSTYTYEELFKQTALVPTDPEILLANGIIYKNGTVDFNPFIKLAEGYPDTIATGDYNFTYVDDLGNSISGINFQASFNYYISPRIGTTNSSSDFGYVDADAGAFAFATEYQPDAAFIQLWNNTDPENPVLLAVLDADDVYFFDSWVTNSLFEPVTGVSVNFREEADGTYTMLNANPGSLMYNVVVDSNGPTSVQIVLPNATHPDGTVYSPAFDLHSGNPIKVYSDMNRTVDVTTDAEIFVEGNLITVNVTIPDDEIRYVRLHLDYAPEGTTGWVFPAGPADYHEDLPFYASFLNVDEGFSLDQVDQFVAAGSG